MARASERGPLVDLCRLPYTVAARRDLPFPGDNNNRPGAAPVQPVRPLWFADMRYAFFRKRVMRVRCGGVVQLVLQSARVQSAAARASRESAVSVAECRRTAGRYLAVMRATISTFVIRCVGYVLLKVFRRTHMAVYVCQQHMDTLRATHRERYTAATGSLEGSRIPIIYVPLHKSHLDYMMLTWCMFHYDLPIPHVASGDNLNLSGLGWLLRRLGAFFIRRRLDATMPQGGKDYIYRSVLHAYVECLLHAGHSVEFFTEGSRSRTGKPIASAKAGIMSILVQAVSAGHLQDAILVPCCVSYEKPLEGTYTREMLAEKKRRESVRQAIASLWNALGTQYGYVHIDFAQPISLQELIWNISRANHNGVLNPSAIDAPSPMAEQQHNLFDASPVRTSNPAISLSEIDTSSVESFNSQSYEIESHRRQRLIVQQVCTKMLKESEKCSTLAVTQLLAAVLLHSAAASRAKGERGAGRPHCCWELAKGVRTLALALQRRHRHVMAFDAGDAHERHVESVIRAAELIGPDAVSISDCASHVCPCAEARTLHASLQRRRHKQQKGAGGRTAAVPVRYPLSKALGTPAVQERPAALGLAYYRNGLLHALQLDAILCASLLSRTAGDERQCVRMSALCDDANLVLDVLRYELIANYRGESHVDTAVGRRAALLEAENVVEAPSALTTPTAPTKSGVFLAEADESKSKDSGVSFQIGGRPTDDDRRLLKLADAQGRRTAELYAGLLRPLLCNYAMVIEYALALRIRGVDSIAQDAVVHALLHADACPPSNGHHQPPPSVTPDCPNADATRNALRYLAARRCVRLQPGAGGGGEQLNVVVDERGADWAELEEVAKRLRALL